MPSVYGEVRAELLYFSYASEIGYSVASDIHLIDSLGNISCNLLLAKTRFVLMRQITIPSLELFAATMSVVINKYIRNELDIGIKQSTYWTDSCIVLQYIISDNLRFHTFFINRVSQIRDGIEPLQWRYVNTKTNPADYVSRGLRADVLIDNKLVKWAKVFAER